jgi:serine/threonine protein kinase
MKSKRTTIFTQRMLKKVGFQRMNDEQQDMDRLIGKTLGGRFQIESLLGKGGMGVVFKAFDSQLKRSVAIKVIRPKLARQRDLQKHLVELEHEAQIGARFEHPGIARVYDFGWDNEYPYIVMELIPGGNLFKIMQGLKQKQKWISISEALQLMIEISLGLGHVHQHGVYHLDIKPENILFKSDPNANLQCRPVITDLGLAWLDEKGGAAHLGDIAGTPVYMSPEQALGKRVDARSDVYALGILVYELLTGRQPFNITGDSFDEVVSFHSQYNSESKPAPRPAPLKSLPEITKIVVKALTRKPDERFNDANQMARELRLALRQLPEAIISQTIAQSAKQGVSSLFEQYQEFLELPSSTPAQTDEPPPVKRRETIREGEHRPAARNEGYVEILTLDGSLIRTVPLTGDRIIIGRDQGENMITLDHPNVSRAHARLELIHKDYYITDLGSENGTYLDNSRLLHHRRERWRSEEEIRLAIFRLRLMRAEPVLSGVPPPEASPGRLQVEQEMINLFVELDQSVSYPITLTNHGKSVDHYFVSIEGRPAEWVDRVIVSFEEGRRPPEMTDSLPAEVQLRPGDKGTVKISFHPPLSPQIRAEEYSFTTRFTLQKDRSESAEVSGILTVKPLHMLEMDLYPKEVQEGVIEAKFELHLHNQSNVNLPLQLEAQDDETRCRYHFNPASVTLLPDQETTVELKIVPETIYINALELPHQFTVTAQHTQLPEFIFEKKGRWKQYRPFFDIELVPIASEHVIEGLFLVNIRSRVDRDIDVQLEVSDSTDVRSSFDRNQIELPTGGRPETVNLKLRAGPLPGTQDIQHDFIVTARPVKRPHLYLREANNWVQVPPDFELSLDPEIVEDEIVGHFELKIKNNSGSQLNMKLDVQSVEDSFQLTLPLRDLMVSPEETQSIHLQTEASPVMEGEDKTHHFSIIAWATEAPQVIQTIQGQWIQHPPRFTLSMEPERQSSSTEGHFVLWVSNESKVDLTLQLEVVEALEGCRYIFDRPLVRVPAHQNYRVSLTILPDTRFLKRKSRTYPFTIVARSEESPEVIQQVQAIWVQTPVDFRLDLRPETNQDSKIGKFTVVVNNQGDADLPLHLEATDREGICTYMFDLSNTLSAESRKDVDIVIELDTIDRQSDDAIAVNSAEIIMQAFETRYITLESIAPSLTNERRHLPFTITAYAAQLPETSQRANSSWEQTLPVIGLILSPRKFVSADKGAFQIRLRNRNDMDFNIHLEAVGSESECLYMFDTPDLYIPKRGSATAHLIVRSAGLRGIMLLRNHYFTVKAGLSEHRSITYQEAGLWRQIRPIWMYIVFAILMLTGMICLATILLVISDFGSP